MAGPRCSICSDPRIDLIDAALLAGSRRGTARAMGLSLASVNRHVASGHLAHLGTVSAQAAPVALPGGGGIRERLEAQLTRLENMAATPGIAHRAYLEIITAMRLLAAELAKQPPAPCPEVNLAETDEWIELRERIVVVVRPYPEVMAALRAAFPPDRDTAPS